MMKVLLVSNDFVSKNVIFKALSLEGISVQSAYDSNLALKIIHKSRFDYIIVDCVLKDGSGLNLYKTLRKRGIKSPILMLGESRLDGFLLRDLSFDSYDYMMKPFKSPEFLLKFYAFTEQFPVKDSVISFGEMAIDRKTKMLVFKDKIVQLSQLEMDLIIMLAQKGGEAIHPKKLTKIFDGENKFGAMKTFAYMSVLRHKLQKVGFESLDICFVQNQGYKLVHA